MNDRAHRDIPVRESLLTRYARDHQHPVNRALHWIGIPLIIVSILGMFIDFWLGVSGFTVGWILQFIGHAFEGKKPSFFSDPRFLLVGPLHFVRKSLGRLE